MSVEQASRSIESESFSSRVSASSLPGTLVRAIARQPEYHILRNALRTDPDASSEVLSRIQTLLRLDVDPRYLNPFDIPIVAYLMALTESDRRAARMALDLVDTGHNLVWAHRVFDGVRVQSTGAAHAQAEWSVPNDRDSVSVTSTRADGSRENVYLTRRPLARKFAPVRELRSRGGQTLGPVESGRRGTTDTADSDTMTRDLVND
jgi:hypothetical protein